MFTGLVQALGEVTKIERGADSAVFTFTATNFLGDTKLGDSISVNGVCLTAIELSETTFAVDVMVQTLKLTSLDQIEVGSKVDITRDASLSTLGIVVAAATAGATDVPVVVILVLTSVCKKG